MKDKLKEYALLAEIIGAIAIVLSLIFVGLQLRQGNDLAELNLRSLERQQDLEWAEARQRIFVDTPELVAVQNRMYDISGGNPAIDEYVRVYDLTQAEAILWWRYMRYSWEREEADWNFSSQSASRCAESAAYLAFPDHKIFWQSFKQFMDEAFVICTEAEARKLFPEIDL